jgi:phosphoserine phosphatase RsbU/P
MTESGKLTPELKYRLLLDISQKISSTLDLEQVLNVLIEAVKSVVDYDAAGIFVLNSSVPAANPRPFANVIAGIALHGFPNRPTHSDPMLKSGKGIVGYVIRTGESAVVADVHEDPRYIAGRNGTRSEIAVPIVIGDQVIGAVNLESNRLAAFAEADAEVLRFISNAAALSIEKAILHRQLLEKKWLERQLETARQIQTGLLPRGAPKLAGYDIDAVNVPNFEIGGDYFDYLDLSESRMGIAIADVSGKGVPAALVMATFRAALRTQVQHEEQLPRIMEAVNRLLTESTGPTSFVTAVYGVLDPSSGDFSYVNCGHNPPLLLHADGGGERLDGSGLVLGVLPGTSFGTLHVQLKPGDTLVLYTDGVIEAGEENDAALGEQGLERLLRQSWNKPASAMIQSIVAATRRLSPDGTYSDDFTLLLVRRQPTQPPCLLGSCEG